MEFLFRSLFAFSPPLSIRAFVVKKKPTSYVILIDPATYRTIRYKSVTND